tara:strand:- start:341 stop:595 length:255 start_codon:yes stop_codon:yes gene_type:complete
MDMLKRFLNVVTIGFVLLLILTISGGFSDYLELVNKAVLQPESYTLLSHTYWLNNDFAPISFWLGIGILVFNYIVFKKITLWHK